MSRSADSGEGQIEGVPRATSGDAAAEPDGLTEGRAPIELLETILRLTSARIAYVDGTGRFLYATPAVGKVIGVPAERIAGHTLEGLGAMPGLQPRLQELSLRMIESGRAVREVITLGDEANPMASEFVIEPVPGPDGTIRGAVVTAWDVTELTQALQRIAHLERAHAVLSEINQAIVRIAEPDQLFERACQIAADVGGFELAWIGLTEPNGDVRVAASAGPAIAILDGTTISTRDEPSGWGTVGTAIRENRTDVIHDVQTDVRMDAWRSVLIHAGFRTAAAFPISVSGKPIGAFALYAAQPGYFDPEETRLFEELAADISFALDMLETERGKARAEAALRESERHYRELFEQNPQPMWAFDVETLRFLAVNDAAVDAYGYSRGEFLEMTIEDIRPQEDLIALLADVAAPGPAMRPQGVWRHRRKDGVLMDVEVSAHDLDFDGRKARLVSTTDVSERRRLESQLAEAARMEAMGHLAGGIAHDFNNLLTAVNGYADLLVADLGDSPFAEDAREIRRAGARAAELTQQVLAFARRQVLAPRPVDVNAVVGGVGPMLRRLIGEQVRLVTRLETEPAVVLADPGQLEQVLVNLAINARDAMPEGGAVDIAVSCVADAARLGRVMTGPAVLITVKDDGAGMDDETLTHAFEPFFTTKPTGAGTGLGLATVHGIVLQSNGEIWAESAIGLGTTVSVLLAQIDATPEPLAEQPSSESNVAGAATVLVAEDDAAVRAFVVLVLQRAGYRVLVAGSAAEAEALTDGLAEPIDVLLTDLMMPETNGQMLAQRLTTKRPGMRVILMSGYGPELSAVPLDPSLRFLAKPFSGEDLAAIVAAALAEPVVS